MACLPLLILMWGATWVHGGTNTANQFIYKPHMGAGGVGEKALFDAGLDKVDAHLGRYKTLGDPGHETLSAALSGIGSTQVTLAIPAGAVAVTSNTTIPANVHLKVMKGAEFQVATNVTLTINGGLTAGPYKIFSLTGTGVVAFDAAFVKEVYAEWWGAKADYNAATGAGADSADAINAALAAHPKVVLLSGKEGLPTLDARAVAQTRDGDLWFACGLGGLVRYVPADSAGPARAAAVSEPSLKRYDMELRSTPDGALWERRRRDVVRYEGKHETVFTNAYTRAPGYFNAHLAVAPDGRVWLTGIGSGLVRFDRTNMIRLTPKEGLLSMDTGGLSVAPDGAVWFGDGPGALTRYDGTHFTHFTGISPTNGSWSPSRSSCICGPIEARASFTNT